MPLTDMCGRYRTAPLGMGWFPKGIQDAEAADLSAIGIGRCLIRMGELRRPVLAPKIPAGVLVAPTEGSHSAIRPPWVGA